MRVSFITACKKVYVPVCTEYINIARPVEICILYFLWEMEQQKCGRKRNVNKKVAECNSFPELTRLHISTSYLQLLVDFDSPQKISITSAGAVKSSAQPGTGSYSRAVTVLQGTQKNIKRRIGKRRTLRDDAPALGLWRNRRPEAR